MTAEEYRVLVGLRPRHPLWAPTLLADHTDQFRDRLKTDKPLQKAMEKGRALAAIGDLQRRAQAIALQRTTSLERARQLAASGSRLGIRRASRYRARRTARARDLGYSGLEAYYRRRYLHDRARLVDLAAELKCGESAVRGDLTRLGLGPDRTRSHGARWR